MMLCNTLPSSTLPRLIPIAYQPPPAGKGRSLPVERILHLGCGRRNRRGISVVTRAGPSSTSYIFAFIFPLSLLAVTVLTSMRIADKLDDKYLEELAVNQAILEAEEDDEVPVSPVNEPTSTRIRNRPKREVQQTST